MKDSLEKWSTKTIDAVYLPLDRFPLAWVKKPLVNDSNKFTDIHSPGFLAELMLLVGLFPFHGLCIAFLYIQLAHIRLLSLGTVGSDLGMMSLIAISLSLLKER